MQAGHKTSKMFPSKSNFDKNLLSFLICIVIPSIWNRHAVILICFSMSNYACLLYVMHTTWQSCDCRELPVRMSQQRKWSHDNQDGSVNIFFQRSNISSYIESISISLFTTSESDFQFHSILTKLPSSYSWLHSIPNASNLALMRKSMLTCKQQVPVSS